MLVYIQGHSEKVISQLETFDTEYWLIEKLFVCCRFYSVQTISQLTKFDGWGDFNHCQSVGQLP